jgi:excisionase family DNA binding protein
MPRDADEMTPREVADFLDVSTTTIRRWANDGTLTPCRIFPGSNYRRYARADVERIKQQMEAGTPVDKRSKRPNKPQTETPEEES